MGGSEAEAEAEAEQRSIPRLPLFNVPPLPMHSPERSGMLTPPLRTSASVPFRWEQEPGKPKPSSCTALVTFSNPTPKCLELPPRLLIDPKITKLPSPTTVLEGPYVDSDRIRMRKERCGSFSSERGQQLGAIVLSEGVGVKLKENGWFGGNWRKKAFNVRREVTGGGHVFPSFSADRDTDHFVTIGGTHTHNKVNKISKIKRSGSFYNLLRAKSRVWTTICEGLEQMVPWKRRNQGKKDGNGLRL